MSTNAAFDNGNIITFVIKRKEVADRRVIWGINQPSSFRAVQFDKLSLKDMLSEPPFSKYIGAFNLACE